MKATENARVKPLERDLLFGEKFDGFTKDDDVVVELEVPTIDGLRTEQVETSPHTPIVTTTA